MPGIVARQFDTPNKIPAYRGAMSRWLTGNPLHVNPPNPTARVRPTMASSLLVVYPTITRNDACAMKPERKRMESVYRGLLISSVYRGLCKYLLISDVAGLLNFERKGFNIEGGNRDNGN